MYGKWYYGELSGTSSKYNGSKITWCEISTSETWCAELHTLGCLYTLAVTHQMGIWKFCGVCAWAVVLTDILCFGTFIFTQTVGRPAIFRHPFPWFCILSRSFIFSSSFFKFSTLAQNTEQQEQKWQQQQPLAIVETIAGTSRATKKRMEDNSWQSHVPKSHVPRVFLGHMLKATYTRSFLQGSHEFWKFGKVLEFELMPGPRKKSREFGV